MVVLVNVHDELYGWLCAISTITACITIGLLFIVHMFQLHKQIKNENDLKWTSLFTFSILFILFALIGQIDNLILLFMSFKTNKSCRIVFVISASCWVLSKWSMYMYLVIRLHTSFKNSIYEYNKKLLICWALFLILSIIIEIIVISLFNKPIITINNNNYIFYITCRADFDFFVPSILALVDLIACVVNL